VVDWRAGGVLITGVYGSGKSSVAAQIAYLLEQRSVPYALLDLDYLGWAGTGSSDHAEEFGLMLRNLADVAANYRQAGIEVFVLAYFIRDDSELRAVQEAAGLPLRVARLDVPIAQIEQRLASDVTSGRRDDLRAAASSLAASEGAGVKDVVIRNDRPIQVVAQEVGQAAWSWVDRRSMNQPAAAVAVVAAAPSRLTGRPATRWTGYGGSSIAVPGTSGARKNGAQ